VAYTQRKEDNAKSQGILNMSTSYICKESRPTLPNTDTLSTSWTIPVIAFSYTLSTHQYSSIPIFLLILLLTTLSSKLVLFFFLFQKLSYKASIFFLFIHNTSTKEVISSHLLILVYPSRNSKKVSVWRKPPSR
jgi:hypothetical protein